MPSSFPAPAGVAGQTTRALRAGDPFVLAIWFGLGVGFGEALLTAIKKYAMGLFIRLSPQVTWMAPLAFAIAFCVIAAGLTLAFGNRRERAVRWTSLCCLFVGVWSALSFIYALHQGAAALIAAGVGIQGSAWIERRLPFVMRAVRVTVIPMLLVVPAIAAAVNLPPRLRESRATARATALPRPTGPNVVVIVWDTVRAQNLDLYGYSRVTTPHLDRLAERGTSFERAYSPAPWTLPSHASMFTGLPAHRLAAGWEAPLEKSPPTLAERFSERGYRTGGFVANVLYAGRDAGIDRGFQRFRDYAGFTLGEFLTSMSLVRHALDRFAWRKFFHVAEDPGRRHGDTVTAEFTEWFEQDPNRPFFAFLNYYDAHSPRLPPAPYDTKFGHPIAGRWPLWEEGVPYPPEDIQAEIDAYDGAISYLDDQLQIVLDTLANAGVLENTIVIVTADHGEHFGEHGLRLHGNSLYNEQLHVPLVIAYPKGVPEGRRIATAISTQDLAATIQDLAGDSSSPLPGHPLSREWTQSVPSQRTLVASVKKSRGQPLSYPVSRGALRTVIQYPLKLIRNTSGEEELYDLATDPGEQHNLVQTTDMTIVNRLRALASEP